ncbi:MAG: hypothetical protein IMW89_21505 [Ktedonobacteraceae bacterium]|nr:hypothetical protein [Ktedonobacteraceae bacterium]
MSHRKKGLSCKTSRQKIRRITRLFPPLASAASDVQSPRSPQSPAAPTENPAHAAASHSLFYTQDQDDDLAHPFHNGQDDPDEQDEQEAHASPLVLPFQHSAPLPPLTQTRTQGSQTAMGPSRSSASVPGKPHRFSLFSLFSLRLVKLFLIVSVSCSSGGHALSCLAAARCRR